MLAVLNDPVNHVVLFRPAGDKRWPVPFPVPVTAEVRRVSSTSSDIFNVNNPINLINISSNCGLNAVIQYIVACESIANAMTNGQNKDPLGNKASRMIQDVINGDVPTKSTVLEVYNMLKSKRLDKDKWDPEDDSSNLWFYLFETFKPEACTLLRETEGPCPEYGTIVAAVNSDVATCLHDANICSQWSIF